MASQHFVISAHSKARSDSYVHMRNAKEISEKKRIRRKCMKTVEIMREAKAAGCNVEDII